jgi:hypothetical protein
VLGKYLAKPVIRMVFAQRALANTPQYPFVLRLALLSPRFVLNDKLLPCLTVSLRYMNV